MLFKKLLRTALKYKAQFISMIIMVTLGMGVFLGFNSEWYSLQRDTDWFLEETNYADFRVYSDNGFSSSDVKNIKKIDGISAVSRFFSVNVGIDGEDSSIALTAVEDYVVSTMYITSGAEYSATSEGIWLSDKFASANGYSVGDEITFTYRGIKISGNIEGLAKSGEYMVCVADSNQLMPDYGIFGFAYVSPQKIATALQAVGSDMFYPQINIISSLGEDALEEAVDKALGKTTQILYKDKHTAYAAAQSEIEEGQSMGNLVPVIFLAIGILTMITTMHRITANEKTQIGTLKALGFRNRKISWHYTSYGLFIGVVGSLLGLGLGYAISALVVNPTIMQGTYFDMPVWKLYMPWYCWVVMIAAVAFLTLISFLSVRTMLKGTAADTLRPYVPKKVKPLAIEKTKLWSKTSFGTRWNLRDLFRHKARLIMTLIGVMGCTVLLVGGLGMSDTMDGFLDVIDNDMYHYETRINFSETVTDEQVQSTVSTYKADTLAEITGEVDDSVIVVDVYDVPNGKIGFIDKKNKSVTLGDDGVYICIRLTDTYSVGDTIKFSPYESSEEYELKVVGVIRSVVSENITMTATYAESIGLKATYKAAFTDEVKANIATADYISGLQSKSDVMDTYDGFMEIMDVMVAVLVVAAIILGVVVLYNLGVMSYVERYRELATLKVVGFRNKDIGKLLISQNLWLTVVGLLLGIPAGVGVLYALLTLLASEYELKLLLGATTYIVSILVTVGVSLVVGFMVARRNRKINMVEALKGQE